VDHGGELCWQAVPRERQRQVPLHLGRAQEPQRHLTADPVALELELDRDERVLAQHQLGRAVGEQHQQPQARATGPEVGEQVHGGRVGPVRVIEEEYHRPQV
jgi:hypothetical protein